MLVENIFVWFGNVIYMSRIGKKVITIPEGVTITFKQKERYIEAVGPKGNQGFEVHRDVIVSIDEDRKTIQTSPANKTKKADALWGTMTRLIENSITGVFEGFSKKLELNGVGFRMNLQGKKLVMALGFSHPVEREVPEELEAIVEDNTLIIRGIDKQKVGQFAADIRSLKPVEPYKAKGFKYDDEIVRRKEGKKTAS